MQHPEVVVAIVLGLVVATSSLALEAATPGIPSLFTPEGLLAGLLVALFGAIPFTVLAIRQYRATAGGDWWWLAIAVYWLAVLGLIGNYRVKLFVIYAILATAAVWLIAWVSRQGRQPRQDGRMRTGKEDEGARQDGDDSD